MIYVTSTRDVVTEIVSIIEGLHTHSNEGQPDDVVTNYFEHVWAGMPKKLPATAKRMCTVEIESIPEYQYAVCPTVGFKEMNILVTVYHKGQTEIATLGVYDLVDLVVDAMTANQKLNNKVMDIEPDGVMFGEVAEPEGKKIIAGAQITFIVKMEA